MAIVLTMLQTMLEAPADEAFFSSINH